MFFYDLIVSSHIALVKSKHQLASGVLPFDDLQNIILQQIRDFYWGTQLDINNPKGLVDAVSDSSYAHPVDTSAKIHAMKSNSKVLKMIPGFELFPMLQSPNVISFESRKLLFQKF